MGFFKDALFTERRNSNVTANQDPRVTDVADLPQEAESESPFAASAEAATEQPINPAPTFGAAEESVGSTPTSRSASSGSSGATERPDNTTPFGRPSSTPSGASEEPAGSRVTPFRATRNSGPRTASSEATRNSDSRPASSETTRATPEKSQGNHRDFLIVVGDNLTSFKADYLSVVSLDFAKEVFEHQLENELDKERDGRATEFLLELAEKYLALPDGDDSEEVSSLQWQVEALEGQLEALRQAAKEDRKDLESKLTLAEKERDHFRNEMTDLRRRLQEADASHREAVKNLKSQLALAEKGREHFRKEMITLRQEAQQAEAEAEKAAQAEQKAQAQAQAEKEAAKPQGDILPGIRPAATVAHIPNKPRRSTDSPTPAPTPAQSDQVTPPISTATPQTQPSATPQTPPRDRLPHPAVCYIDDDGCLHDRDAWKRHGKPDWDHEIHWRLGNEFSYAEVPSDIARRFRRGEKFDVQKDDDYAQAAQAALRNW